MKNNVLKVKHCIMNRFVNLTKFTWNFEITVLMCCLYHIRSMFLPRRWISFTTSTTATRTSLRKTSWASKPRRRRSAPSTTSSKRRRSGRPSSSWSIWAGRRPSIPEFGTRKRGSTFIRFIDENKVSCSICWFNLFSQFREVIIQDSRKPISSFKNTCLRCYQVLKSGIFRLRESH